jgi:hypothetical protein
VKVRTAARSMHHGPGSQDYTLESNSGKTVI